MDCLADTFGRARSRQRRITAESETLADWAAICDDIICSSTIAALTAEDPTGSSGAGSHNTAWV